MQVNGNSAVRVKSTPVSIEPKELIMLLIAINHVVVLTGLYKGVLLLSFF